MTLGALQCGDGCACTASFRVQVPYLTNPKEWGVDDDEPEEEEEVNRWHWAKKLWVFFFVGVDVVSGREVKGWGKAR